MSAVDWAELDRLLDELLDLPEPDRVPRLEKLFSARPQLAVALRRALDDAAAGARVEERFPSLLEFDASADGDATTPSERVGVYRIRELLGEGGMGTVYLAERADGSFEQTVALKVLRRREVSPGMRARFLQERQLLARLSHPRIARLLDGGVTSQGGPFFAMEYVEGEPIDRHCDARRATIEERLRLFDQVLDAVQFAHRNLVLHRDLKPNNILVTAEGDVKLLDFGVAKLLESTPDTALTQAGDRWLTPDYASPEQLAGEPVSTGSDVYSLGVLLHELLTGSHPFGDLEGAPRRAAMLEGRVPRTGARLRQLAPETAREAALRRRTSPRALAATLRGDLDAILARATRKEPEERYRSVEAFRSDLDRYRTGHPVDAARGNWLYATRKFWRRHRVAVGGTVLVVGSLAVGVGVAVHQARVARGAEARAGAINRFLTDELLGSASPEVAQGRELTVTEVVSAAERNLPALRERPEVEGSIRSTLAHVRLRLGDSAAARAQIEAAERAFEAVGERGAELAALRRI
ncbi:MAG: serine/threonine protein kinase, partial [Acidobacteria bacterium]|nr:serine/threonine protein kinase [Acidobacteriota bacterium]